MKRSDLISFEPNIYISFIASAHFSLSLDSFFHRDLAEIFFPFSSKHCMMRARVFLTDLQSLSISAAQSPYMETDSADKDAKNDP
jgi:hypothetical protein